MTTDTRATALIALGYTPRQAAFLALVALHGGYFLRRQYAAFMGCQDGAVVVELIDRLLPRHHATRATYCRETHVYHLCARPLYDALDLSNSRNRRPAGPAAVTFKLMTLDVVLRHREATFLATEAEKVAYFTTTCGLPTALLPATCYQASKPGGGTTTRYFVDRAPIYLTPPEPTVSVVFLQVWSDSLDGFAAFLAQYRPLLADLPHARVVFTTTQPTPTSAVTARWDRFWARSRPDALPPEVSQTELLAHFEARRRMDRREWEGFKPHDLDRLRDNLARFNTPTINALYRRWSVIGEPALEAFSAAAQHTTSHTPVLAIERLPFRYPLFPAVGEHS